MKLTRAALAFVASALMMVAVPTGAWAASVPVIDQAGWNSTKKVVQLPNGLRMAYVETGNPNGEPLLLLHGYTDSSRSWSLLVPYLSKYRLLIPDQRGHGASDAPECCYSSSQFAYDAKLFLDALKIERAAVAGHSLGSMVAITMAAEYPDRVTRIALLASTALVPVRRGDWLWNNVTGMSFPIDPTSSFIGEWAADPEAMDRAFATAARAETVAVPRQAWRGVLRELTELPIGRHAADVRVPVLLLSAGKDPFFNNDHHEALLKAFPGASDHIYPTLGHNFLWEKPAEVAARIDDFLTED